MSDKSGVPAIPQRSDKIAIQNVGQANPTTDMIPSIPLSASQRLSSREVMRLQHTIGNRAVQRLLQRQEAAGVCEAEEAGGVCEAPTLESEPVDETLFNSSLSAGYGYGLSDVELQRAVQQLQVRLNSEPDNQTIRENYQLLRVEFSRRDLAHASTPAAHAAAAEFLIEFAREQVEMYPPLVRQYIQQPAPDATEKTRVLGLVTAAVARMEFLLGTIYHGDRGASWETTGSNRGPMVDDYTGGAAIPWCTRFATTVLATVRGDSSLRVSSGYQVANPGEFAGNGLDYNPDAGGAFVGTRRSQSATASAGTNYNPWAALRQTLQNIANGTITNQTAAQAVEAFFTSEIRPQAGDILVMRRGSSSPNSFSAASESHTLMVERLDGHILSVIEGNAGSGTNQVTGRELDLTNPADVEEIVHIARPSLASGALGGSSPANPQSIDPNSPELITEGELIQPIEHLNSLIERLSAERGYIPNSPGASVADLAHQPITPASPPP